MKGKLEHVAEGVLSAENTRSHELKQKQLQVNALR